MNSESEKAQAFIGRLLQNPALNGFSALQREEQIIQFLQVNAAQLAPTLSAPSFFPGKSWNEIFATLVVALFQVINADLFRDLETITTKRIDYTFLHLLRQQHADSSLIARQLQAFLKRALAKSEIRRAFTGPFTALHHGLVDRYLDESFSRKAYVHFELTKVQRLRMGRDEIRSFVDLTLLLKPAVLIGAGAAPQGDRGNGTIQTAYAEKALRGLQTELKLIPEAVLKSAVHASVSFNENRFVEATARLAAIHAARARNYHPNVKVDRGADSPDKSWFSTARRNYKFYGFDIKMLDELYKVAAENVW